MLMDNYEQVLDFEKEYEKTLKSAKERLEEAFQKYHEELKAEYELKRENLKKELDEKLAASIEEFKRQGEEIYQNAISEAENLRKDSRKYKAIEKMMGRVKNV